MGFIVAIFLFIALVSIFLATYIMNKNVKLPDNLDLSGIECNGCKVTTCKRNSNYDSK